MSYTFYDATILMAKGALLSLSKILAKAEAETDSAALLHARLVEDMKPLTFQVHYATFQAESLAAKVSGRDYTEPEEDLDSYAKIHARIRQALDSLDQTDKDMVNRLGEEMTIYNRGAEPIEAPIKAVTGLVNMPNIYFHVSMAYAILKKEGVSLEKRDWSRGFVRDYI